MPCHRLTSFLALSQRRTGRKKRVPTRRRAKKTHSLLICRHPSDLAPYNAGCRGFIGPFPPPLLIRDCSILSYHTERRRKCQDADFILQPETGEIFLWERIQNSVMTFFAPAVIMKNCPGSRAAAGMGLILFDHGRNHCFALFKFPH